ncbi:MAG: glycosyltransferase 87 family protein [Edaphocola sp.]
MGKASQVVLLVLSVFVYVSGLLFSSNLQRRTGMGDMRSRVVAARLVNEGRSPYFYNWYPGDDMRYFDGWYVDSIKPNKPVPANMTSSPVLIHVLQPFAEANEWDVERGFFLFYQASFLLVMVLVVWCAPRSHKLYSLLPLVPFVWTDGWLYHTLMAQLYMLLAFVFALACMAIVRQKQVLAGILLLVLTLLRPNGIVMCLPFMLCWPQWRSLLFTYLSCGAGYVIFCLLNSFEKTLWQDFFASLKLHQARQMIPNQSPIYGNWYVHDMMPRPFEGADYIAIDAALEARPFEINTENTNVKDVYRAFAHKYPPACLLQALFGASVVVVMWVAHKVNKLRSLAPHQLAITGMLLFFLSNFFSTVTSNAYQWPQWYAVAAVYGMAMDKIQKRALVFFAAGLVVNQYFFPDFRGKHIVAEMLLLASCVLTLVLPPKSKINE